MKKRMIAIVAALVLAVLLGGCSSELPDAKNAVGNLMYDLKNPNAEVAAELFGQASLSNPLQLEALAAYMDQFSYEITDSSLLTEAGALTAYVTVTITTIDPDYLLTKMQTEGDRWLLEQQQQGESPTPRQSEEAMVNYAVALLGGDVNPTVTNEYTFRLTKNEATGQWFIENAAGVLDAIIPKQPAPDQ